VQAACATLVCVRPPGGALLAPPGRRFVERLIKDRPRITSIEPVPPTLLPAAAFLEIVLVALQPANWDIRVAVLMR
jgi:hypothetical protein